MAYDAVDAVVVRLLGPVSVVLPDGSPARLGPRPLGLVTLLALQMPRVVSVDQLVAGLWDAPGPPSARNAVQVHVSALRSVLGPVALRTQSPGYSLDPRHVTTDAARFEQAWRAALDEAHPTVRSALLREALTLWSGEPLANLQGPPFAALARALDEQRQHVLDERIDADLEAGRHARLVAELTELVRSTPSRERRWRQLAVALYRCGRQADALSAVRQAHSRLAEELGRPSSVELRQLETQLLTRDSRIDLPGAAVATTAVSDVPEDADLPPLSAPAPLTTTPLLGREGELDRLVAVVDDPGVRLVTVLGTGGIGKTRIAQAVAERRAGALWISLEATVDSATLLQVIGSQLGVHGDVDGGVLRPLAQRLTGRLLILDNIEHLPAAAPMIRSLLAASSQLTVLTTSRVALQVLGEVEFHLRPLSADEHGAGVELFLDRARAAGAALTDSPATRAELAAVVSRLDGLPLAIELAAARARLMPTSALLDRLSTTGDLPPVRGPRPERHRSLTATMDWSYGLLDPASQRVLARLSVFSDGFTLGAAEQICAPLHVDALAEIGALVEASLVRRDASTDRFHLLETVRSYAATRLAEDPDAADAAEQHAAWITGLALRLEPISADDPAVALDTLAREGGNLDAALAHLHHSGDGARFAELIVATRLYWLTRTALPHLTYWLHRVDELPVPPLQLLALACSAGYACWSQHDHRLAAEWVERGLAAAIATGPAGVRLRIDLTAVQALIDTDLGRLEQAERSARQALQQASSLRYGSGRQSALVALGRVQERQGSLEGAVASFTEALAQPAGPGPSSLHIRPLLDRAHVLLESGRLGEAEADVDLAAAQARRCGDRVSLLRAGITRGLLYLARRRTTEAELTLTHAGQYAARLGERQLEGRCFVALAAVHAHRGELEPARALLAHGLAQEDETPVRHPIEQVLAAELDVLGDPRAARRARHLPA